MGSLALRAAGRPHAENLVANGSDELILDAESTWVFEGSSESLDAIEAQLSYWSQRTASTVLTVCFGNSVGVFRLPGMPTFLVRSGKWGDLEFARMLEDLVEIATSLPFAAGTAAPLPYDRTTVAEDCVLYTAFVYLRHILSASAPEASQLAPALESILRDPHRLFRRTDHRVPLDRLGYVSERTCLDLLTGRDFVTTPRGTGGFLAEELDGHLPERVTESRVVMSLDSPENRFVLGFLRQAEAIVQAMRRVALTRSGSIFERRIVGECDDLQRKLSIFLRRDQWRAVGPMTQLPTGSTVLQARRGYRDVYRHFIRLHLASIALPIDRHRARDLLESKDIARLYELWCYFQVVATLRSILGEPNCPQQIRSDGFGTQLDQGVLVEWSEHGVRAGYNVSFGQSGQHRSYSRTMRPDVTIFLRDGGVHILDAKFRVTWNDAASANKDTVGDIKNFKRDDLDKMHAYRDAIPNARSAWVMYPGTVRREFSDGSAGVSGVGAVPVVPGEGGAIELRALIERMLA